MGMFDSLYDASGDDWQTKALGRSLQVFHIGDDIPGPVGDYQMEVIGEPGRAGKFVWSFATVLAGRLVAVPVERDPALPLCLYSSGWEPATEGV